MVLGIELETKHKYTINRPCKLKVKYLRGERPVSLVSGSEQEGVSILSDTNQRLLAQEEQVTDGEVREADTLDHRGEGLNAGKADRGVMTSKGNGVTRGRPLDGVDPSRSRVQLSEELSEGQLGSEGTTGGLGVDSLDDSENKRK